MLTDEEEQIREVIIAQENLKSIYGENIMVSGT